MTAQPLAGNPPGSYPVAWSFAPAAPRWTPLGRRRSVKGIPGGSQIEIVLRHGNRFSLAAGGDIRPGGRRFIEADRLYGVQLQDRKLICGCRVEPAGFLVTAEFLCAVKDSCDVVSAGRANVQPWLESYLRRMIGEYAEPPRNAREQTRVRAKIRAYFTLRPPDVAGLQIDLDSIEISFPNGKPGGA